MIHYGPLGVLGLHSLSDTPKANILRLMQPHEAS